ncbi:MAG: ribonucleoside-diphosphate reductase subunit alpha [Candidatus Absconditabacterales bacterium]|nr:ribonucleoside-diphosphate reductase subunit alpha [Candidatus Absconditabacterales bacterium]
MFRITMYRLNDYSRHFLSKGYLQEGMTAEDRIKDIAQTAEKILGKPGFADKFYNYMAEGFYSLASPVRSNFGLERGLPISCFGSYVGDDMGQILFTQAEVGMMSKYGGGTSAYFGDLRHRGMPIKNNGVSSGAVHFMQLFESLLDVVSQGAVRRGHISPYLPIEHGDIEEFLKIGTEGNPIQKITHGVTCTDQWLKEMEAGDIEKRKIWAQVIQRRNEMGYPYIMFVDTANRNTVDCYKDKGHKIYASNMCTEIMLPSNEERSFVCCLSSINLLHYDKRKDTDAVETLTYFLDAVMQDFIDKLEKLRDSNNSRQQQCFYFMQRAYKFAKENRALGLGVLGRHSLLQSKMIPIDSNTASRLNVEIFKLIREKAYQASEQMAKEYGEPEVLKGYGRRNATLLAIAPTTSSAFILGQVSQGIEPIWSNCYVKDIAKIKVTMKNQFLEKLLEEKGKNTEEVWLSIRDNDGSVLHLDFLSDHEKEVFKTFQEINQRTLIDQAAARQDYIDQAQSLNLAINPKTPAKDINELYLYAWKIGVKTLYYQHSVNAAQQFGRMKEQQNCKACEA